MNQPRRIAFLFVGGTHHVFHTLPVACALAMRADVEIDVFAADQAILRTVKAVLEDFPDSRPSLQKFDRWPLFDRLGRTSFGKLPMLWRNRRRLRGFDALVTAECTSIALRRMGVKNPRFICLPHGAGDRAISFEPRFRLFDLLLVAGDKTERRMVERGVRPNRVRKVGYPKAEYCGRRHERSRELFQTDAPIIFYNPHFRTHLSSLGIARGLVRELVERTDFNLIVAPHIRSFEDSGPAERMEWERLAIPGRVIVDTRSDRLIDMSYVAAADIYLGDVSSQVYEFLLLAPRPCVFVNSHDVAWEGDPDYAFWQLGEVAAPDEVAVAVGRAEASHRHYLARQQQAVAETFAPLEGSIERAADAILTSLSEGAAR